MKIRFNYSQNQRGAITSLQLSDDPTQMNWVVSPDYLAQVGYHDSDKLLGEFTMTVDGQQFNSVDYTPKVETSNEQSTVSFALPKVNIMEQYCSHEADFNWQIQLTNRTTQPVHIDSLGLWASFAYVMFRDKNVYRNASQSVAVFPSISANYTKLALMRRDGQKVNMGVYQTQGTMMSVGTYAEYTNRFFENVSPSLDGILFHRLELVGGYAAGQAPQEDWIYPHYGIDLVPGQRLSWSFAFQPVRDQADFYRVGRQAYHHPIITVLPIVTTQQEQHVTIQSVRPVQKVELRAMVDHQLQTVDLTDRLENGHFSFKAQQLGEHQLIVYFSDGSQDMVVFNVLSSIDHLLRQRVHYLCNQSYDPVKQYFNPVSNQGESLGKLSFILQECLLDPQIEERDADIQKVEQSAVNYVRPKWFINGNLLHPTKLYGDFYRVMDLEYIAHLFYLLSKCPATALKLNSPTDYLKWAATVFDVRVNPDLHDNQRGKEEAQMLGVYYMYINDLLTDLQRAGLKKEYHEIATSWHTAITRVAKQSNQLTAAVTEHFFDNAGFGPATGALAVDGDTKAAQAYANLLRANIGFSNDFRAQAPDRWWEALSYMMHSLWGGITAAAAQIAGEKLGDPQLVAAGYRATVAMLYMYDANATATERVLKPGEAASTYSIAGPNINRPDLSRNRFGQSIFASDGGIFAKLFPDGYTGEDDWDMGEELVAYLNGFGQKTYLYRDEHQKWQVINGRMMDNGRIESAAPYIHEYVDLTHKRTIKTTERIINWGENNDK